MRIPSIERGWPQKHLIGSVGGIVYFVLFFLYLWLYVDLRFLYGGGGIVTNFPVYFKGWPFMRDFLVRPGGPLEYLAALMGQLFYIGWAGALVVTIQAWLMSACVGYILRASNLSALRWLRYVPAIILLVAYTQYTCHLVLTTAFLAALSVACLYLMITASSTRRVGSAHQCCGVHSTPYLPHISIAAFLVLSAALYYVAAGAYLLFAVLCAIYELFFKRRLFAGLLCLLCAAAVPYVAGVVVFRVSAVSAFSDLTPFSWRVLSYEGRRRLISAIYVLYSFLPAAMLISALWKNVLSPRMNFRVSSKRKKSRARPVGPIVRPVVESLALFTIAAAAVLFSYDAQTRTLSAVHFYACNRMWPQVLRAARGCPNHSLVINAVNRALYHTGRLGYDMFRWPQTPDALLKTGQDQILTCWQKFDTQIDLGLMNMAEKNLTECMEVFGEQPAILERLALINMVKANYDSARIYLGALSKTLFHSKWADDYLARLRSDPNLSGDERIQHLRSVCMKTDDPAMFFSREKALRGLLENNGGNHMAFEYLIAWYMLTRQLDNSVRTIERLGDFNYKEVPTLYEEALLVYVYGTKKTIKLPGYETNPMTRQRIERFSHVFNGYGRNKQAAYSELAKDYGDSYFFYHIYGISGVRK